MVEGDGGWSSEEEELNFGGTMGVAGMAAIRSATFVENEQNNQAVSYNAQKVSISAQSAVKGLHRYYEYSLSFLTLQSLTFTNRQTVA